MKDSHGQTAQAAQHEGQCDYDIDGICIYCDAELGNQPTIVQDYREYTADEILHGIVKFTEQAGWGDPANLGHWLGAAQRWAKERV